MAWQLDNTVPPTAKKLAANGVSLHFEEMDSLRANSTLMEGKRLFSAQEMCKPTAVIARISGTQCYSTGDCMPGFEALIAPKLLYSGVLIIVHNFDVGGVARILVFNRSLKRCVLCFGV